ncbi:hypothetical protein BDV29DRAFT_152509 [Aspergillus leporis]|uniref:Uncharacterized protein n=1 Tax=Aspergillus leporis TaxID=41062 RepID=A0A5N5XGH8_9EURO|nr:hypothetical protein BDV29DRAFT_152509 [Aspergillus leporis]
MSRRTSPPGAAKVLQTIPRNAHQALNTWTINVSLRASLNALQGCAWPVRRTGEECVVEKQPECPPGTDLRGGICVAIQRLECPLGLGLQGKKGGRTSEPDCPPGQKYNGFSCALEAGPQCPLGLSTMARRAQSMQFHLAMNFSTARQSSHTIRF